MLYSDPDAIISTSQINFNLCFSVCITLLFSFCITLMIPFSQLIKMESDLENITISLIREGSL